MSSEDRRSVARTLDLPTFLALASRASDDLDARRVLGDALEELGWWTGAAIAASGATFPGYPDGTSLPLALAEPDHFVIVTMLRADPPRAFEALACIVDENRDALACTVTTILADATDELSTDEELRVDAAMDLDPRWRSLLAALSVSSPSEEVRTAASAATRAFAWLAGAREDAVPTIDLGEYEDFLHPLLFIGILGADAAVEAALVRDPELVRVPGLVLVEHQWGGHACYNSRLLGFLAHPPEPLAAALMPRMAEISAIGWVTDLPADDLQRFSAVVASAVPVPPFAWGGEALVATPIGVPVSALRSLPVVRFRARSRGWEGITFAGPYRPAQWDEGILGEREERVLATLERRSGSRVLVAWLWGNSD